MDQKEIEVTHYTQEDNLRAAGNIKRYHIFPTIRPQTVADHTWNVMRIYDTFYVLDQSAARRILYHDCPEIATGDIPFAAKRKYPKLKQEVSQVEHQWYEDRGLGFMNDRCDSNAEAKIKICDLLEMMEFASEEVNLGNTYARHIVSNVYVELKKFESGNGAHAYKAVNSHVEQLHQKYGEKNG
jgi:5'-deoxynucleotidase YfbR-like HD superfamily hydrolase